MSYVTLSLPSNYPHVWPFSASAVDEGLMVEIRDRSQNLSSSDVKRHRPIGK